jgi:hypothetical protein
MWSMWNAPSDRDYYHALGLDFDVDEPEICRRLLRPVGSGRGLRGMVRNESGGAGAGTGQLRGGTRLILSAFGFRTGMLYNTNRRTSCHLKPRIRASVRTLPTF